MAGTRQHKYTFNNFVGSAVADLSMNLTLLQTEKGEGEGEIGRKRLHAALACGLQQCDIVCLLTLLEILDCHVVNTFTGTRNDALKLA